MPALFIRGDDVVVGNVAGEGSRDQALATEFCSDEIFACLPDDLVASS